MNEKKQSFWLWVGIVYIVLFVLTFSFSFSSITIFGMEWNWGLATFLAVILYTIASMRKVGPTELGARIFLGRPVDEVSSGFVFVPVGIFELKLETRLIIQAEFPADPEYIYRKDDMSGAIPPGKFPPIRIPFGIPKNQGGNILDRDPLRMRLIEEVVPIVRFRVKNYIMFLTTIETVDKALVQLQDLCVAILSREFGRVTPAAVIANYAKYNKLLTKEIQESVSSWGIELESAKVKVINFSHDLNKAVQQIAENTAKGKAHVIEAEGLKKAAILEGEGRGSAEKAELDGRTAGLKNMMDTLALKGGEVLGAETARGITNNPGQKTVIVGADGFGKLAAVAGTILGETLKVKEA